MNHSKSYDFADQETRFGPQIRHEIPLCLCVGVDERWMRSFSQKYLIGSRVMRTTAEHSHYLSQGQINFLKSSRFAKVTARYIC